MNGSPLLGICIPTYRRPEQLRRCVESVIRAGREHGVVIHLADDSTDDTNVEIVRRLQAEYPHVVHHRNAANLGIDRNILHAVDVCDARYAWILGEDDRLTPDAVATVVDALQRFAPPFLYVNYASVDEDLSMVLSERSLDLAADREMDAEEFLATSAWSAGFIGACVVEKAAWARVRSERHVGTWFAHVGTILEAIHGERVRLLARAVVLNRCGTARAFTWTGSTFDVLHGWDRMIDGLRGRYPDAACDAGAAAFRRAHGIGTVRFFAYLRADRALTPEAWERFVRRGPYGAAARGAAWLVAHTPAVAFQAARAAVFAVRRQRNRRLSGY